MSVLQSVCYNSEVVFETGSPGDGGDASLFVVVKKGNKSLKLQSYLTLRIAKMSYYFLI